MGWGWRGQTYVARKQAADDVLCDAPWVGEVVCAPFAAAHDEQAAQVEHVCDYPF